ncbi:MAG: methyltransferase [Rikenellaceae bacterium]|nr:methyltransferase [Rikenellaceae bacterium]
MGSIPVEVTPMPNDYFRFKQFTVRQDKCAMKVGTDGVLLGAWVTPGNFTKILDIGTGTGVIALMMAQRNPDSEIDAVEIEEDSCNQAEINFELSPWNRRLTVFNSSIQDFARRTTQKYDLIISNPPYFINSLKSPYAGRTSARHTDCLTQEELLQAAKELLADKGRFAVIYPLTEAEIFIRSANSCGLYCIRRTDIRPLEGGPVKRVLMEFSLKVSECIHDALTIEKNIRHSYTEEYRRLTADFYIKF